MRYTTPAALEAALRAKARASSRECHRVIEEFPYQRFLARIFLKDELGFVLKGGQSMLTRIEDARATRDIDLFGCFNALQESVNQVIVLAEQDLRDFIRFEHLSSEQIFFEEANRRGAKITFSVYFGAKKRNNLGVDLVVGDFPTGQLTTVPSSYPIKLEGLDWPDYTLFPVADSIADKFCAIVELHGGGKPSSRMKDLVDLVQYAVHESVGASELRIAIQTEATNRRLLEVSSFAIPKEWFNESTERYRRLAVESNFRKEFLSIQAAKEIVSKFINPALARDVVDESTWNPKLLEWENPLES